MAERRTITGVYTHPETMEKHPYEVEHHTAVDGELIWNAWLTKDGKRVRRLNGGRMPPTPPHTSVVNPELVMHSAVASEIEAGLTRITPPAEKS